MISSHSGLDGLGFSKVPAVKISSQKTLENATMFSVPFYVFHWGPGFCKVPAVKNNKLQKELKTPHGFFFLPLSQVQMSERFWLCFLYLRPIQA